VMTLSLHLVPQVCLRSVDPQLLANLVGPLSPRGGQQYGSPSHGSTPSCGGKENSSSDHSTDLWRRVMTITATTKITAAVAGGTICGVGAGGSDLHDNSDTALGTSGAPPLRQLIAAGQFVRSSPRGGQWYGSPAQGSSPLHG
jgi:hypothetical protein